MAVIRSIAAGLVVLATVLVQPSAAGGQAVREEFSAILSNISNAGGVGITPLTIRIVRWTPDQEHNRLMETLRKNGQEAFLRELVKVDPVGSIATPTSLKYDFFYARSNPTDEGGRRIFMITDRPMTFDERMTGSLTRDYPFTVIELQLDKEGRGQGTLAQLVQLQLVGEFLGVENLASGPMKLSEVKKVK